MRQAFKISPTLLCLAVAVLAIGELAAGTPVEFVAMVIVALLSIGFTYNRLGGLSSLSGIVFASLALRYVVISQIAKVVMFEPANLNLDSPQLTISVYATFFFFAMVGAFLFSDIRLKLPRPWEPSGPAHANRIYTIALVLGVIGKLIFEFYTQAYGSGTEFGTTRTIGVALSGLLLFSIVLAIDSRIRNTDGRHSFGPAAWLPWAVLVCFGFIDTVRQDVLAPTFVYIITCYVRGYRFRRRHYIAGALGLIVFNFIISPLELYSRDFVKDLNLRDRVATMWMLMGVFNNPAAIFAAEESKLQVGAHTREQYYNKPGTYVLSRVSMIRLDSTMIDACRNGYHYGFEAIEHDLLWSTPSFIYKNKPRRDSGEFLGDVAGVSPDIEGAEPAFTMIGDSFGAFGWIGTILVPLFALPLVFVVYESMFSDISRPWGTIALGMSILYLAEGGLGRLLGVALLRIPIDLVLMSYLIAGVTRVPFFGRSLPRKLTANV